MLEAEVRTLQRMLLRRDNDVIKMERELHKLRVSQNNNPNNQINLVNFAT